MFTIKGVVIHITELSEKGRFLRVLTEKGLTDVFVRGAKKSVSKNNPGTEIFCYAKFSLSATVKNGETRYILDSSEVISQFYELRLDIKKLALASYFAYDVSYSGVSPETLRLFLLCLHRLSETDRPESVVKAAFELRYACEMGFMPDLTGCEVCHQYDGDLSFVTSSGKLLCTKHNPANAGIPLTAATLHALRYVCLSDLKKICDFTLTPAARDQFSNLAEHYIHIHSDKSHRNKALEYYKKL
jgi:DNA repair protein RecO (recombination protein O)